ncbi:hypothetical protein BJ138DRAFT_978873, partial [Hygrophoropsis aurantiaca]
IYRKVAREVAKSSISPAARRNKDIHSNLRAIFENNRRTENAQEFERHMENTVTFLRSQREYKALLERYNPLIDLTGEERIEATARRVGLNMPL